MSIITIKKLCQYLIGVDIGAARIKATIIDEEEELGPLPTDSTKIGVVMKTASKSLSSKLLIDLHNNLRRCRGNSFWRD